MDLIEMITEAWQNKVLPIVRKDPDELARRLARRRSGMMNRPPRAWCIALRAADQRINPATACCSPELAAYPLSHTPGWDRLPEQHEVTITSELCRRLTHPLDCRCFVTLDEMARELGLSVTSIKQMARRGVFDMMHIQNWNGRRGRPVPFVKCKELLDPCFGRGRTITDPLWGTMWRYVSERVPDGIDQTLTRVPHFIPMSHRSAFMGWHWVCPSCRRQVRMVYYPLPPVYGIEFLDDELLRIADDFEHPDARQLPPRAFACMWCHNIMQNSRVLRDSWNRLISHLSGGLLYGHEVPRPKDLPRERKVAFHPMINREPSNRRQMVLEDILAGLSYRQIMKKQRISKSVVGMHAATLYRQHRVKGPAALRELHQKTPLILPAPADAISSEPQSGEGSERSVCPADRDSSRVRSE